MPRFGVSGEPEYSLDSAAIIGLNTIIACHGQGVALKQYLDNCKRVNLPPVAWRIRYLKLYVKYSKSKDNYIDVPASQRAIKEAIYESKK